MSDARNRLFFLMNVLLLGVVIGLSVPAEAGPTEAELGDLAKPLGEKVAVDLIGTPLPRALEAVARQAGLNILISPQHTGLIQGNLVNLTIDGLTAAKTLNLIGIATDTDWYIQEGVVLFAPRDFVRSLRVTTRVFDIRELLESVPNYIGPDLSIDGTLSNTSSGGSSARQSESYGSGGGGGGGLFGDSSDLGSDMPSRQELVDQIVSLIQTTIGEADHWLDDESTVTELNGNLIVKTTPEELEQIDELLSRLSVSGGRMIVSEGQFYVVPRGLVDGLNGGLLMDEKGYGELMKKLSREGDANARRIASGRTICFNGQRIYVYAGSDKALLSDLEPVPDAAGVDPTLSTMRNGAVFDLKPTITLDGKHISVAVRTEAVDRSALDATPVPVGSSSSETSNISTSGSVNGKVAGAGKEGKDADLVNGRVEQSGTISGDSQSTLTGNAELGLPEQDIILHRTNVRVPNGGAVVLAGVTSQFKNIDADTMEVIFVLRLRIVE